MGGLVARYFLEQLDGWRDCRMLITFGTPYRGSPKALEFIANGFQKSLASIALVDLSEMLRSFTSVYQLLPIYPCLDKGDGLLRRVGETTGVPNVDFDRAANALKFHREMTEAVLRHQSEALYRRDRYTLYSFIGTFQPTLQSASFRGSKIEVVRSFPGRVLDGDGTVPRVSATPVEPAELAKLVRPMFVAQSHGSLQNDRAVLDGVQALLENTEIVDEDFRGSESNSVSVVVDDVYSKREKINIEASCGLSDARLFAVIVNIVDDKEVARARFVRRSGSIHEIDLDPLPEGAYRITVYGVGTEPVTDLFLVAS
jgi:hypothetical protein